MKKSILILSVILITLMCLTFSGCKNKNNDTVNSKPDTNASDIKQTVNAVITVENYGEIKLELDADTAPITVANFVNLVNEKFYDGLTFHRSVPGFMIQGGDPNGDGTGGSKETIKGEFLQNGVENNISHKRGVISMARLSNDMNSASSQFFIVQRDSDFLDGGYAAFGQVTEGMEIVDKMIDDSPVVDSYSGLIDSAKQPKITSIKIVD